MKNPFCFLRIRQTLFYKEPVISLKEFEKIIIVYQRQPIYTIDDIIQ